MNDSSEKSSKAVCANINDSYKRKFELRVLMRINKECEKTYMIWIFKAKSNHDY